ncbi:MAG: CDP-alcohol phosphatidyltransferase family protein [DPANN group archaeon]|nr:CDP-alcohol phosphatidyltransferase family protein [DPANN group archaeon]
MTPFIIDVHPDRITIASLLAGIFSGYLFFKGNFIPAAIFLGLNGFLDVLDGEVAKNGIPSKKGDFLDHTFDRVADIIIFMGIAYNPMINSDIAYIALVTLLLVSYMGTQAQALTEKRMYGGVLGRAGRHVILFVGAISTYVFSASLTYALYMIAILSVITVIQRFKATYEVLE